MSLVGTTCTSCRFKEYWGHAILFPLPTFQDFYKTNVWKCPNIFFFVKSLEIDPFLFLTASLAVHSSFFSAILLQPLSFIKSQKTGQHKERRKEREREMAKEIAFSRSLTDMCCVCFQRRRMKPF